MSKDLSDFVDEFGFIYHHDEPSSGSGFGDSCQRTFMNQITLRAQNRPTNTLHLWDMLNKSDGEPRRHWNENFWPGQKGFMSRDNLFPAACALSLIDGSQRYPLIMRIIMRGGFLWNTKKIGQHDSSWKIPDFVGPLMLLILLRLTFLASLYVRLPIFFHLLKTKKDPNDTSDDLNIQIALMTLDLLTNKNKLSRSALYYYVSNREPLPEYRSELFHYRAAIKQYFNSPIAPPLDIVWLKACDMRGWP